MTEIEIALTKMGYRPQNDKFWAKPVANMILCFSLDKNEIVCFFKGIHLEKVFIWDSEIFITEEYKSEENNTTEKQFLSFLKIFERSVDFNHGSSVSDFEFITQSEYFQNLL